MTDHHRPFGAGTAFAVAAAVAFGVTAPLVQQFGNGAGPFATAALLYIGAALASATTKRREQAPGAAHLPRITLAAVCGAFAAPACLAFGLQRASGVAASLMLNLETVFTTFLAWAVLREHLGARVLLAILCMLAASSTLVIGNGGGAEASFIGLAAVGAATLGWSIDNILLQPLAGFDPASVVIRKAAIGVVLSLMAALTRGEPWPHATAAVALIACGATGYGLSLKLYLLAQRRIGAGRTGSVFAVAPFVGAVAALALGRGALEPAMLVAGALFALGALLHATERHQHLHTHEPLDHEHQHRHDDGHHDHVHDPPVRGAHSHPHHHDGVTHDHPHAPDPHHAHRH